MVNLINWFLCIISDLANGVYNIQTEYGTGKTKTYCQMTSLKGCAGGGWTMVMKINGNKVLFRNFELHYSLLFSGDCYDSTVTECNYKCRITNSGNLLRKLQKLSCTKWNYMQLLIPVSLFVYFFFISLTAFALYVSMRFEKCCTIQIFFKA